MSALKLRSVDFRREREQSWRELDRLVSHAERRGVRSLSAEELERLPVLYRNALSSLSVARAISLDRNVVEYLESLCARAYVCVYGARGNLLRTFWRFFSQTFPHEVRAHARLLLLAAAVMLLGVITAFAMTRADPDRYYAFVSSDMAQGRTPAATTDELEQVLRGGGSSEGLAFFASFLFTHNAQVGLLCFASGFVFGVPVLFLLFMNGTILGAMWALYHDRGLSLAFLGWILPHGVTELGAIVVCAAAGLALGRAQLFPGVHARVESLALTGRHAARLVSGAVAMLFVAGLIEGIFRQTVHDTAARWLVALATVALWAAYLRYAGRTPSKSLSAEGRV